MNHQLPTACPTGSKMASIIEFVGRQGVLEPEGYGKLPRGRSLSGKLIGAIAPCEINQHCIDGFERALYAAATSLEDDFLFDGTIEQNCDQSEIAAMRRKSIAHFVALLQRAAGSNPTPLVAQHLIGTCSGLCGMGLHQGKHWEEIVSGYFWKQFQPGSSLALTAEEGPELTQKFVHDGRSVTLRLKPQFFMAQHLRQADLRAMTELMWLAALRIVGRSAALAGICKKRNGPGMTIMTGLRFEIDDPKTMQLWTQFHDEVEHIAITRFNW
ncbi:MAG: hypothetical protein J5J00_10720 [Deltaproteobacteria bacterium]|nr:hypothetical protein [Deltaproteobacteria bacterium]